MGSKFLVTSLGSIGRRHVANLRLLRPDATIAVLRTSAAPAAQRVSGVDLELHSLAQALAFAPEAAIVASPAPLHLELAEALAGAGVAVLIEKPLAATGAGLGRLAALCAAGAVNAAVGYNLRFLPSLAAARRFLLDGAIGQVLGVRAEVGQYLPDWRPGADYSAGVSARRALGGGALLELSHELDYLLWMFGAPDTVSARGGQLSALALDVEDMVELCLDYGSPRRLVNVHLDFLQRAPHRSCRFIGSEGTLVWHGLEDRIDLYRAASGRWEQHAFPLADRNQMYLDELRAFLGEGGREALATVDQGRAVMAVIDAARAAMAGGACVKVSDYAG